MSSNITKDSFDPKKRYDRVIFSQKRTVLDFELNEVQEILRYDLDLASKVAIGDGPLGEAFRVDIVPGSNQVVIRRGILFHKGTIIHSFNDVALDLSIPIINSVDTVYLEWWHVEVDSSTDPSLLDPNVGLETATREELVFQILFAENAAVPPVASGHNVYHLATINRNQGDTSVRANQIQDLRLTFAQSYITNGGLVTVSGGTRSYYIDNVSGLVAGTPFSVPPNGGQLNPNDKQYLYISNSGQLLSSGSLPSSAHVPIAIITSDSNNIVNIEDIRKFAPASLLGGLGREFFGGHLFLELKAAELIQPYQLVTLAPGGLAAAASEASFTKMPVVGIAYDRIYAGQTGRILLFGVISNPAWSLGATPGVPVYINNGILSNTYPKAEGTIVQQLGVVVDNSTLFFKPDSRTKINTIVPSEKSLGSSFSVGSSSISAGKAVAVTPQSLTVKLANATENDNYPCIGVAQKDILSYNAGPVVTFGEIDNASWNWIVGQPVYLSSTDGGLVQKPFERPVTLGMAEPIRLFKVSGSNTTFTLPTSVTGRTEIIWEDGLVRLPGLHYTRTAGTIVFNYNIADSSRISASFSLQDGGLSSPVALPSVGLSDNQTYQVPAGAGPNQLVWYDGKLAQYGVEYIRDGNLIKFLLSNRLIAPGTLVSASFSSLPGAMSDPSLAPGPYLSPINGVDLIYDLPGVVGRQLLVFTDGILLEPGFHYRKNPDGHSITLLINTAGKITVSYSMERVVETGTHTVGAMSTPQRISRIDSRTYQLPIGANNNTVVYLNGNQKDLDYLANGYSGDYQIVTKTYINNLPAVQVVFNYDILPDPVTQLLPTVSASYGIRGGGMTSPIRLAPQSGGQSFTVDASLPSSAWIWLNGSPVILNVDYTRTNPTTITFNKILGQTPPPRVSMSAPVGSESMSPFTPLVATSDPRVILLPGNPGYYTNISISGNTLLEGKDYFRTINSQTLTLAQTTVSGTQVIGSSSLEAALAGVPEIYNVRVGHALSPTKMFVSIANTLVGDLAVGGMNDPVQLQRVDGFTFKLPPGSGSTEVIFIDGLQQRPGTSAATGTYTRNDSIITFYAQVASTSRVSASVSTGGGGMTPPTGLSPTDATNVKYALPPSVGEHVWVFLDGRIRVPNVDYVIQNGIIQFINPVIVSYASVTVPRVDISWSVNGRDMYEPAILSPTSDPRIYNLPANAGNTLLLTVDGVEMDLGVHYTRIPSSPTVVLAFVPAVGSVVSAAYSRKGLKADLSLKTSEDIHWKSPVNTYNDLPLTNNNEGDIRLVNSTGVIYRWSGGQWVNLLAGLVYDSRASFAFTIPGQSSVGTKQAGILVPYNTNLSQVLVRVDNAPVGASLIIDIKRNGTSIFSDPSLRPTLASGSVSSAVNLPTPVSVLLGDAISMDINQVGSNYPGGDSLYIAINGFKV